MNKLYTLLSLLFVTFTLNAQIVDIPDANFKDALINDDVVDTNGDNVPDADADTNNDGEIQLTEAEAVISLNLNSKDIFDFEGLQSFSNVEILYVIDNLAESFTTSGLTSLLELDCSITGLTALDLSASVNLIELRCSNTNLTTIDLAQNTNLEFLNAGANWLTSLDLTNNTKLHTIGLQENSLAGINLSQNIDLAYLNIVANQLTSLNLSNNPNLIELNCLLNIPLTDINIKSGNNEVLEHLIADINPNLTCVQVDDVNYANNQLCISQNVGWCIDDNAAYSEDCLLGQNEFAKSDFVIYPNPANEVLQIRSDYFGYSGVVYALNGMEVIRFQEDLPIDISMLKSGVYFVALTINGNSVVKRFVKA